MAFTCYENTVRQHKFSSAQSLMHDSEPDLGHQKPISQPRIRRPFWSGRHVPTGGCCGTHASPLLAQWLTRCCESRHSSFISTNEYEGFLLTSLSVMPQNQWFPFSKFLFPLHALVTWLNVAEDPTLLKSYSRI